MKENEIKEISDDLMSFIYHDLNPKGSKFGFDETKGLKETVAALERRYDLLKEYLVRVETQLQYFKDTAANYAHKYHRQSVVLEDGYKDYHALNTKYYKLLDEFKVLKAGK